MKQTNYKKSNYKKNNYKESDKTLSESYANSDNDSQKQKAEALEFGAFIKIVVFFAAIALGAIISLMVQIRPQFSENEKRELAGFPKFEVKSFLGGEYFSKIDLWFSDTFPFRDELIACNDKVMNMYGIRNNTISGEIIAGDAIPDVDIDVEDLNKPQQEEPQPDNDEFADLDIDADDVGTSIEKTDNTTEIIQGEMFNSVFIIQDAAYDYYTFSQKYADRYIAMINSLADTLEGKAKVYSMIVPTAIDIALDDATRNSLSSSNQRQAMLYMYSRMNRNVTKTFIFDTLKEHRYEYVYFRTDHHWTARGAYYAYTEFISQLGQQPHEISEYDTKVYEGFTGSFCAQKGGEALKSIPDMLTVYKPIATNDMKLLNKQGQFVEYNIITDVTGWNSSNLYSTFIGGDNPYLEINNPNITDGSSCLVVKESFGNAFIPYLTDHFENVYAIDYRYYNGTISELVKEKGIDNVLIMNNISATSAEGRIAEMSKICK